MTVNSSIHPAILKQSLNIALAFLATPLLNRMRYPPESPYLLCGDEFLIKQIYEKLFPDKICS